MNKKSLCVTIVLSFFLFIFFGGVNLKAAECPTKLNVSCSTSASSADSSVSSTVETYLGYDISLYNANSLSASQINSSIGTQERYPTTAVEGHSYVMDRFGSKYYYLAGRSREWSGAVGQIYIRGQNGIIFQDKTTSTAYNKAYAYQYCKKKSWGKCKDWSGIQVKEIYDKKVESSTFSVKDGKLTYTKLNNVQMVIPSFEVNVSESGSMTVYSQTQGKDIKIYNMHGYDAHWITFAGDTIYNSDGTLKYGRGCFMDFCTDVNGDQRSQALMTTLVMVYTAKVTFYYYKGESNGITTLGAGTTNAKVYVTYKIASGAANKTMQALNGYNDEKNQEMGSSGITKNISFVPVQYDLSDVLNPNYWDWSNVRYESDSSDIKVSSAKFNGQTPVSTHSKKIYTNYTSISSDGINVTAIGIDTERDNTVSVFVSGKLYYKAPTLVDFTVSYTVGGGSPIDLTSSMSSYFNTSKDCSKTSMCKPIEIVNQEVKVTINTQGNKVEVYKKDVTDTTAIKNFRSASTFNYRSEDVGGYSNQTGHISNNVLTLSTNLSQALSIIKIVYINDVGVRNEYYFTYIVDKVSPTINNFAGGKVKNGYVIVTDESELHSCFDFVGDDNVSVFGSTSNIKKLEDPTLANLSTVDGRYKYLFIIEDEAKNQASYTFTVIIDKLSPNEIVGDVIVSGATPHHLDATGAVTEIETELNDKPLSTKDEEYRYSDFEEYMNSSLPTLESEANLTNLTPLDVVLEDESEQVQLKLEASDDGEFEYTSAGIRGVYIKHWVHSEVAGEGESESSWKYVALDSSAIKDDYSLTLDGGINYIAVISIDYVDRFYKQEILDLESMEGEEDYTTFASKIAIKIYAVKVYGTPYINEIVATEDGFGAVVRDDLAIYSSAGINTIISDYLIVDAATSDTLMQGQVSSTYIQSVMDANDSVKASKGVIGEPINSTLSATVAKDKVNNSPIAYAQKFEDQEISFIPYGGIEVFGNLVDLLENKDVDAQTFDNQMLIRGTLLENTYLYIKVVVVDDGKDITLYQKARFASSMVNVTSTPQIEMFSEGTAENIGYSSNVFSISGNDEVSYWDGPNMMIRYGFNFYKERVADANGDTVETDSIKYDESNFIMYYKVCYETEGSFGVGTVCRNDGYRYVPNVALNLGEVNGDMLYKVYVGVVTALKYDAVLNKLIEIYNNDDGYKKFDYVSSRFMSGNDTESNLYQLGESYYEIYFGKFVYDTSIPEVTIEYVTINEYNPDGINKLKDPKWITDQENFIIKLTIKYESDKYRGNIADWVSIENGNVEVYWFGYYYATGNSVCGNVDRIECGMDKAFNEWNYTSIDVPTTYDPNVGLVYYLQYPTTEQIQSINPAYSVDAFDLVVKVTTDNGRVNEGMDLVVDEVVREENKEYITIYYDQDGPSIKITSSPDKDPSYYAVSISAEDVSSNVAKVSFYYGKIDPNKELDPEVFLLYEEVVNKKTFSGYSAKLTQKGWYTVVAEDEFGQMSYYSFEVVQLNEGVMFSPTLDDTDQIQENEGDGTKVVVTILATVVTLFVALLVIAIVVFVGIIYIKYGKAIKTGKKVIKKAKPIAKYTKNAGGWVGAASKVVDAIPDEAVEEQPKQRKEPEVEEDNSGFDEEDE